MWPLNTQLPLNEALELLVKDMSSVLHQPDIFGCGINALAILYWPLEHVWELCLVSQEVRADPVHHTPVLHQVILQGVACQHDPPPGPDLLESLERGQRSDFHQHQYHHQIRVWHFHNNIASRLTGGNIYLEINLCNCMRFHNNNKRVIVIKCRLFQADIIHSQCNLKQQWLEIDQSSRFAGNP